MNTTRKIETQSRRISSFQNKVIELQEENNALKKRNKELSEMLQLQREAVENAINVYETAVSEIKELKEKYKQAITDAHGVKKEYSKKFNRVLKQFKSQV